ncbi:hypothetical protein MXB_2685 [Myxobolus squamalis]|nr:hypothetical protein MXB_2685 [Myxobolus squamalis]
MPRNLWTSYFELYELVCKLTSQDIKTQKNACKQLSMMQLRSDTHSPKNTKREARSLMKSAESHGIPKWLVSFRHLSTHKKLNQDLCFLKHGLEFCYAWLLKNYWNPTLEKVSENHHRKLISVNFDSLHNKLAKIMQKILKDIDSVIELISFMKKPFQ